MRPFVLLAHCVVAALACLKPAGVSASTTAGAPQIQVLVSGIDLHFVVQYQHRLMLCKHATTILPNYHTTMLTPHFILLFDYVDRSPSHCKSSRVTFIQLLALCSAPASRSISTAGRSSKRCFTQLIHCAPLLT